MVQWAPPLLLLAVVASLALAHGPAGHQDHGYPYGAPLQIQCKNDNGTWSSEAGIVCLGLPGRRSLISSFKFGVDSFFQCSWIISPQEVPAVTRLINREDSLRCRAVMTPGHDFFVPFDLPIWGVVEDTHIHVDNHLNFIFHIARGSLMAVAAYPVRDQFGFVDKRAGGLVMLHGHVKFFAGESYSTATSPGGFSFLPNDPNAPAGFPWSAALTLFVWCFVSALVTFMGVAAFYFYRIKPQQQLRAKAADKID